jgi:DNA-binding transcriptional LysR family regulator
MTSNILAREPRVSLEESVQALLGRIPPLFPTGPLILDEVEIILRAAIDGVGQAFMSEEHVTPHFRSGALVRVLEDSCPPFPGSFLLLREPTVAAGRTIGPDRDASGCRMRSGHSSHLD